MNKKLGLLALACAAGHQTAGAQEARPTFQVRAQEVVLGDGNTVENGVMVVEDGRIVRVSNETDPDPGLPLIDHDGVLTAGIVACQTESGTAGEAHDKTRSLLPQARLLHAFDPDHSDFEKALSSGITTVVLTPTGQNVAGGITAVVKAFGGSVLKEEGHLALSFAAPALSQREQQFFFFFDANRELAAEDGGPENTSTSQRGARQPTSYSGTVRVLSEGFADPEGPYARAARGELPVFLEAWDRHEVQRAASFAMERGLVGAIYGAPLAGDPGLLPLLAESGLGVVIGPYASGQRMRSLETLRDVSAAGVPVAFALDAPHRSPESLRYSAAMALAAGAEPGATWRALTADGARIAGVDDRVGTLERGKDADFVLWSGNPLDLSSRVESVYVDGELAYSAPRVSKDKEDAR